MLFRSPSVEFGGSQVGGTRISHMSGLDKPLKVPLLIKRGKSAMFTVQPLPDAPRQAPQPPRDWNAEADKLQGNTDALRALYMDAQAASAAPETLEYIKTKAA